MFFSSLKKLVLRYREQIAFGSIFVILSILLFRNPFSLRTLIPNLEPYPDTFHYIVPAMNLLRDGSFNLGRPEVLSSVQPIPPSVPFLYTFWLLPFFAVHADPRLFYFANLFLAGISFFLFWLIAKKLQFSFEWRTLSLFFFATSFYTYWLPSLAMAENLLIPLFLCCIYLYLQENWQKYHSVLAAAAVLALYGTKYAALPVAIVFAFAFLVKLRKQRTHLALYVFSGVILGLLFSALDYAFTGRTLLFSAISLISSSLASSKESVSEVSTDSMTWFSLAFLPKHFKEYGYGLMGQAQTFLWIITPFWPTFVVWFGWLGLAYSAFISSSRNWARVVLVAILAQWLFMSTFYVVDMRYLIIAFPVVFLGVAALGSRLKLTHAKSALVLFVALFAFWTVTHIKPLKLQVALNLKYAEQPWYYVAVKELDTFLVTRQSQEVPVVISPMSPFFLDFYRTQNMEILPLSQSQDFGGAAQRVWGNSYDYSDLTALYQSLLDQKREIYVAKYGLGNVSALHKAYAELEANFTLTEVHQGCFSLCNIYAVTSKEAPRQP